MLGQGASGSTAARGQVQWYAGDVKDYTDKSRLWRWNMDTRSASKWTWLVLGGSSAIWNAVTLIFLIGGYASRLSSDTWVGVAIAYGWWAVFGGTVATWLFAEVNRWLFSQESLRGALPYQPRYTPRIEPALTGLIERLLFTSLAVILLNQTVANGMRQGGEPGMLGAICAGYVALKQVKRMQSTRESEKVAVSIHSIWASGVSLAFAVAGGWMFNEITIDG